MLFRSHSSPNFEATTLLHNRFSSFPNRHSHFPNKALLKVVSFLIPKPPFGYRHTNFISSYQMSPLKQIQLLPPDQLPLNFFQDRISNKLSESYAKPPTACQDKMKAKFQLCSPKFQPRHAHHLPPLLEPFHSSAHLPSNLLQPGN